MVSDPAEDLNLGALENPKVDASLGLVKEAGIERLAAKGRALGRLAITLADDVLALLPGGGGPTASQGMRGSSA